MTNPSEKHYRIRIVKRPSERKIYAFQLPPYVWQVRISTGDNYERFEYVRYESYDWNRAMRYGNELAMIFNG